MRSRPLAGQHVETWVTASSYKAGVRPASGTPWPTPRSLALVDDMEPRAGDLLALVIITLGLGALGFMVYRIGRSFDRTLGQGG